MVKYLIDSDVFIQAKNFHYNFDFCDGFWNWISEAHTHGLVGSIKKVKAELAKGNKDDPARMWADAMPASFFFEDEKEPGLMVSYGTVILTVAGANKFTQNAINEFSDYNRADAFLIAAAMHYNALIVTHEKGHPEQKRRVPLPDGAALVNVTTLTIFELLEKHAQSPNFSFKQ